MFKFNIPKRWDQWAKALWASFVSGFATAVFATFGASAEQAVGLPVHAMDWKQMLNVGLCGGVFSGLAYLKQSPVPPDPTGNTEIITKK